MSLLLYWKRNQVAIHVATYSRVNKLGDVHTMSLCDLKDISEEMFWRTYEFVVPAPGTRVCCKCLDILKTVAGFEV